MNTFTPADMLPPIAALITFHLATAALGAWKISREEQ